MPDLAAGLSDPDPTVRASTIERVRFKDLKDAALLRTMLRLCRDPTPVPGRAARVDDPFASFFQGSAPSSATVEDVAADRLRRTGLPEDPDAVAAMALVLAEPGPPGRLPRTIAKALGETRFRDLPGALRTIVPVLERYDEPLFEAIARLPEEGWAELARLATGPLRPRLLQELLNHAPAHDLAVAAAEDAVRTGRLVPDDRAAAELLSILASWSEPAVATIAQHLEDRLRWTVAWRALEDPGARPALGAWLGAGAPGAPPGLLARIVEVLRNRERLEGFPIATILRAHGEEAGLASAWGLEDADLVELLREWSRELPSERGWSAVAPLVRAGFHAPVLDVLADAVARAVPWDTDLLEALAHATPPIPGLLAALLAGLRADPEALAAAVPALVVLGPAACREAAEAALAIAEAAPIEVEHTARGVVREWRRGVDVESLAPLVEAAGSPDLRSRLDGVLPTIRG